jgi:hypothetical protein
MEYIPGYQTLKNYLQPVKNTHELFADTSNVVKAAISDPSSMLTPITSNVLAYVGYFTPSNTSLDETNIPTWSSLIGYAPPQMVKQDGIIYASTQASSNVNPVFKKVDNYIEVNSNYWNYVQLSSNIVNFNPITDANKTYFYDTIVNFNNTLYKCKNKDAQCKTQFTNSNEWNNLSSSIVRVPNQSSNSYIAVVQRTYRTVVKDFTIEDIPNETFYQKCKRIFDIQWPYIFGALVYIVAIILAAYSANDLLHKPPTFRILAFGYTLYFLIKFATTPITVTNLFSTNGLFGTNSIFGLIILGYYLYRCLIGPYFFPDSVFPPLLKAILPLREDPNYNEASFFPTLYTYPASAEMRDFIRSSTEAFNYDRLVSHGDIPKLLREALHLKHTTDDIGSLVMEDASIDETTAAVRTAARRDKAIAETVRQVGPPPFTAPPAPSSSTSPAPAVDPDAAAAAAAAAAAHQAAVAERDADEEGSKK